MVWILFAALLAATLALLLAPLRKLAPKGPARADYDLTVYRDQLAELDREIARGTLSPDQADAARTEIQRRILGAADQGPDLADNGAPRRVVGLAAAIALGIPVLAFGFYTLLGSPQLPDQPYSARADRALDMQDQEAMVRNMVAQLTARLEKDPADGKGWALLGRSLRVTGQPDKALEAYRKAARLIPGDTQLRMEYAAVLLDKVEPGAPFPPEFVGVMREILAVDPRNADALYFLGIAEMQTGNAVKGREYFTRLVTVLPEGSEERAEVQKQLDAIKP